MKPCNCTLPHQRRRIVLTGGPGAGKTAVLELVRQSFCHHVEVLPESASILFRGGFPRSELPSDRRAAQRAIFHVQHELEQAADERDGAAIVICDRGTVDGAAYWPGPQDFWESVGTSQREQLARYDVVLHLRVPAVAGYNHDNPIRVESAAEAAAIDERIARAWDGHPHRHFVASTADFVQKAQAAIRLLGEEIPPCCPRPVFPAAVGGHRRAGSAAR
jgi:predicted ATPase